MEILKDTEYYEIREEKGKKESILIKNGETRINRGNYEGISVRVLVNGSWGFASSDKIKDLEEVAKKAVKLSKLNKGKSKIIQGKKKKVKKARMKSKERKFEEIMEELKESERILKDIHGRRIYFNRIISKIRIKNSDGSDIENPAQTIYLNIQGIAKEGNNIQGWTERKGSVYGYHDFKPAEMAERAREKALSLLKAEKPKPGEYPVILDPEMTGVFTHEVVGHACEGDAILEGSSILKGKLGKKIGNDNVNVVDDPTAEDFGHYEIDDEGIDAKRTILIEGGILKNYLTNRESAKRLNTPTNGHARAEDFGSPPLVRMSNTYFLPGKAKVEEVMDVKYGVYIKGMRGGSVDPFTGGFMFKGAEGYEIKNGKIETHLRDITIAGNLLDVLRRIESVGKDFGTSPGYCGKDGQSVPVSDGGPHIRVKKMRIS